MYCIRHHHSRHRHVKLCLSFVCDHWHIWLKRMILSWHEPTFLGYANTTSVSQHKICNYIHFCQSQMWSFYTTMVVSVFVYTLLAKVAGVPCVALTKHSVHLIFTGSRIVTWIGLTTTKFCWNKSTLSNWFNTYNAAGVCRRHVKMSQNLKRNQDYQIWNHHEKMHSNKCKHAKYWFRNSWNSLRNFRIFKKVDTLFIEKLIACMLSAISTWQAKLFMGYFN